MGTVKLVPDYLKLEKFKLSSVHQEIANINQQVQISAMTLPTHNTPPALQNILSNVSDLVKELDFDVKNFLDADSRGVALDYFQKARDFKDNFENYISLGTQMLGLGMVFSKSVSFSKLEGRNNVYSFRSKDWLKKVNGKYPNRFARSIDKFLKIEPKNIASKYLHSTFGFDKGYTHPGNYVKGHLLGLPKNANFASMKTISKAVIKRFGAINVLSTATSEATGLLKKANKNEATKTDMSVAISNTVIKSTATYAGAAIFGTVLSIGGPAGTVVGGIIGGTIGQYAGDHLAKGAEDVIRNFNSKDVKEWGSATYSKGKEWVSGWFK